MISPATVSTAATKLKYTNMAGLEVGGQAQSSSVSWVGGCGRGGMARSFLTATQTTRERRGFLGRVGSLNVSSSQYQPAPHSSR